MPSGTRPQGPDRNRGSFGCRGQGLAPDLIKIDTEGHERQVLAGLSGTILARKPDLFFEHLGLSDEAVDRLCPAGYELFTVENESGAFSRGLNRGLGHNAAFLPSI